MTTHSATPPYFLTFLICFFLWLLLTSSLAMDELLSGALIAAVVSWLCSPKLQILDGLRLYPGMLFALIKYLAYFFQALVKANLDLASRVIAKEIKIQPDLVEIETTMQSDLGKLFLANSITLTPGTLSVDVIGNRILVHWIDCPENSNIELNTRKIVDKFEIYLKGFVK
ncbi:MAG: Na+/H+ antiporter subunit E [Pseudomonadota bacterium]